MSKIDNIAFHCIGKLMPCWCHRLVSRLTGWMFAAVWIRAEQRHQWMWVRESDYYGDCLFAVVDVDKRPS